MKIMSHPEGYKGCSVIIVIYALKCMTLVLIDIPSVYMRQIKPLN